MKKGLLKGLVLTMGIMVATSTTAFAAGNGNDGCHVPGYETSHKDHGQSNEHKINIDYIAFEQEMAEKGITVVRMSENIDSNGWITYHLLDENGKQIEVVHVRGKKEEEEVHPPVTLPDDILIPEFPVEDGSEDDQIMVEPPVLEGEDDFLIDQPATEEEGELPEIGVEVPATPGGELPEIGVEPPVGDGSEDDQIMVEPNVEDGSEEDKNTVPPTEEPKVEEVKPQEPQVEESQKLETLPQTGEPSTMLFYGLGMLLSGTGLFLNKKK